MATKAKVARGTKLERGDGGGTEVFTAIAEIRSISGPGESVPTSDASSLESTAAEVVPGLFDGGEVTFEMIHVGSNPQQQGLRADMVAGTLRNFKLKFPDHATTMTTCSFAAYVTNLGRTMGGPNEVVTQSCTLRISGLPTWTYAP
jgi:hypothetical protein